MQTNRSIVSPLRIDAVAVPATGGLIGVTICPGIKFMTNRASGNPGKDEYVGLEDGNRIQEGENVRDGHI